MDSDFVKKFRLSSKKRGCSDFHFATTPLLISLCSLDISRLFAIL